MSPWLACIGSRAANDSHVVVDEAAQDEAEAQAAYYVERAGIAVALAFVAELEAIYRGIAGGRLVGVSHPRAKFRVPVKRVFMERFPFAVVFFIADTDTVHVVAVEALRRRPGYWRSHFAGDEAVEVAR
jgi:plasmid stabilization system protein ParE